MAGFAAVQNSSCIVLWVDRADRCRTRPLNLRYGCFRRNEKLSTFLFRHYERDAAIQPSTHELPMDCFASLDSNDGEMEQHTPLSSPRRRGSSTPRLPYSITDVSGILGGFNRSSQHFVSGSLGAIRREFPPVFSSRGFFGAWC